MTGTQSQHADTRSPIVIAEGLVAAAAGAVSTYAMRRADPDMWGYLTYGRLFVDHGRVLSEDIFAYTSGGQHWVTFEYAAHILLWLAYQAAGPVGLIALKSVLGAVCLTSLYIGLRDAAPRANVWLPVFLFTAATVSRFFMFRPQLFTFAFFALFVTVLHRHLRTGRGSLWLLPMVMLLWANTHGGFLAGFGAIGLALLLRMSLLVTGELSEARSILRGTAPLWCILLACFAVTFLTPQGSSLWVYVLTEVTHGTNRELIAEWSPTTFGGDTWAAVMLTSCSVLLLWLGWAAHRLPSNRLRPVSMVWVLSCVPIIVMSYVSVRHVPIAMIWLAPVLALLASEVLVSSPSARAPWRVFVALSVAALCAPVIVVALQPRPVVETGGNVLGSRHPCRSVEFLRLNDLTGNVFNPLWWGSYITWELYPQVLVAMDGRNISLFSDEMVRENLLFFRLPAERVDIDVPLRYPSDFLQVPTDAPVLARLEHDKRWKQIFADENSVLFVRHDADHAVTVAAAVGGLLVQPPTSCPTTLSGSPPQ